MDKNKQLIVIGGPTASGKTAKAIQIALANNAEIFSADSRQIYKELKIGVARPTEDELGMVKHHFIASHTILNHYDAGMYEMEAINALTNYFKKNNVAILVGGTGLYINAVINGLDEFPEIDDDILNDLNIQLDDKGLDSLIEELKEKDFSTYESIDLHNSRRVIRALSVIRQTGKKFSSFKTKVKKERPFEVVIDNVEIDRSELYERINKRVDMMFEQGLLEETESLIPFRNYKALDTVGYTELFDYFDGKYSLEEAKEKIKQHTRNYAKRQLTWFRNQM